ncbi:hypothetical protein BN12_4040012 [Nostocoides japonicum T1-X7]|uniref:Uncharacterized protein n=1 Tax=Nostocoides japonicum T1-X7 TaxID=1194083 RepID=A0A077M533_9MICO|nr:hypothetical protein BN12_4040012 [Tetrasphaera japonica T1-X7]
MFPGPRSDELETREPVVVSFAEDAPGGKLTNPLVRAGARFEQSGPADLRVVDLFPPGGDGSGELDLGRQLVVSLPATDRVEAVVCHAAEPVEMEGFAGTTPVGKRQSGPEQDQTHRLALEGVGIDRVVFTAPQNEASLLEISFWVTSRRPAGLADYPHIVDFEPKTRDLYQAATETGEILTASVSSVATDKTLTHTETSETGLSLAAKYSSPETPYGKAEVSGSWSHKWGQTDTDVWQVGADASRERRERQGASTNISQLYNLLTGYHVGTNRATFLMLPRPHVLQPTDRRTFIQGLRTIEGVQEYFLVVTRPKTSAGMCIEAVLETGHFPEQVTMTDPPVEYVESSEDFLVRQYAKGGTGLGGAWNAEKKDIEASPSATYTISQGYVVDKRPGKGDPGHPGVSELTNQSNQQADSSLRNYNYQANSDTSVLVSGTIEGANWWKDGAIFERTYRVHTRSAQPKDTTDEPEVTSPFLITARGLCVCYRSTDGCPVVVPRGGRPEGMPPGDWVVDEPQVVVATRSPRRGLDEVRLPAMKEALRQVQQALARSSRMPGRRPLGEVGYLESDYFASRIAPHIPKDLAAAAAPGAPHAGAHLSVEDLLRGTLQDLQHRTGVPREDLVRMRRETVERLIPEDADQPAEDERQQPRGKRNPPK